MSREGRKLDTDSVGKRWADRAANCETIRKEAERFLVLVGIERFGGAPDPQLLISEGMAGSADAHWSSPPSGRFSATPVVRDAHDERPRHGSGDPRFDASPNASSRFLN